MPKTVMILLEGDLQDDNVGKPVDLFIEGEGTALPGKVSAIIVHAATDVAPVSEVRLQGSNLEVVPTPP